MPSLRSLVGWRMSGGAREGSFAGMATGALALCANDTGPGAVIISAAVNARYRVHPCPHRPSMIASAGVPPPISLSISLALSLALSQALSPALS